MAKHEPCLYAGALSLKEVIKDIERKV